MGRTGTLPPCSNDFSLLLLCPIILAIVVVEDANGDGFDSTLTNGLTAFKLLNTSYSSGFFTPLDLLMSEAR